MNPLQDYATNIRIQAALQRGKARHARWFGARAWHILMAEMLDRIATDVEQRRP